MIGKNYNFNWFDMTDRVSIGLGFALQDVDITTAQRQDIRDNSNDHGSKSSRTLESGRLFSFVGKVVWITKAARWATWKLITDAINLEPFTNEEYLHDLFFQNDEWEDRQVKVLVKEKPKWTNGLNNPDINFTFELYAPDNAVYGTVENSEAGESSFLGGTNFPNSFGDSWWDYSGAASCNNEWNYKAGCQIEVIGELINPTIKNLTNWQQYKINGTTKELVLNSKDGWTVTDEGVDISNKRDFGTPILLSPGVNEIAVFSEGGNATFTVKRFSAWNTI